MLLSTGKNEINSTRNESNQRNVLPFELFCYCCVTLYHARIANQRTVVHCYGAWYMPLGEQWHKQLRWVLIQQTSSNFKRNLSLRFRYIFLPFCLHLSLSSVSHPRDTSFNISHYFPAHFPCWCWRLLFHFARDSQKNGRESLLEWETTEEWWERWIQKQKLILTIIIESTRSGLHSGADGTPFRVPFDQWWDEDAVPCRALIDNHCAPHTLRRRPTRKKEIACIFRSFDWMRARLSAKWSK